jgi:predicted ATP-grasp superfamily ATP-dependent carboligase
MRILVTDSGTRSALATVRALGSLGHEVICGGTAHPSLASVSRFASGFEAYPDPLTDPDGFATALVDIAQRRSIEVVLPMTEVTTLLAAAHQQRLPVDCRLPFPSHDIVANVANKAYVIERARELGVPVPQTIVAASPAEARARIDDVSFPLVLKPARSRVRADGRWLSTGVSYAVDRGDAQRVLAILPEANYPVLLQERIEGHGVGVFACFDGDEPLALFSHVRLREKPPSGGVSVLCESAPLDPLATEHATRLLRSLQWRGVAMVEFKHDRRDGSLRLMEINGRFWGSLQLAIDAGVNFPALAVDVAMGQGARHEPTPYALGTKSRWLAGDTDAVLSVLLHARRSLNLPPNHPGRLRAMWQYLRSFSHGVHLEIERRADPAPARFEWSRWLFGTR